MMLPFAARASCWGKAGLCKGKNQHNKSTAPIYCVGKQPPRVIYCWGSLGGFPDFADAWHVQGKGFSCKLGSLWHLLTQGSLKFPHSHTSGWVGSCQSVWMEFGSFCTANTQELVILEFLLGLFVEFLHEDVKNTGNLCTWCLFTPGLCVWAWKSSFEKSLL